MHERASPSLAINAWPFDNCDIHEFCTERGPFARVHRLHLSFHASASLLYASPSTALLSHKLERKASFHEVAIASTAKIIPRSTFPSTPSSTSALSSRPVLLYRLGSSLPTTSAMGHHLPHGRADSTLHDPGRPIQPWRPHGRIDVSPMNLNISRLNPSRAFHNPSISSMLEMVKQVARLNSP